MKEIIKFKLVESVIVIAPPRLNPHNYVDSMLFDTRVADDRVSKCDIVLLYDDGGTLRGQMFITGKYSTISKD